MLVKLIGLALLVYGLIGVIATVLLYLFLVRPQGPIPELKKLLARMAQKLNDTIGLVNQSLGMATALKNALTEAHDQLAQVPPPLQQVADGLQTIETTIHNVQNGFNAIHIDVPTLPIVNTPQSFNVSIPTVTGVNATVIAKIGDVDIYGPPFSIATGHINQSIGPISLPTLIFTSMTPFIAITPALDPLRAGVTDIRSRILTILKLILQLVAFADEARVSTEQIINEVLTPLPDQLNEVRLGLLGIGNSRLLTLIPLLILGYFGLIHLAFGLVGFALVII